MADDSPFLVLNLGFDIVDGVRGLNLQSDSLSREAGKMSVSMRKFTRSTQRFNEDLHNYRRFSLSNEKKNGGVLDENTEQSCLLMNNLCVYPKKLKFKLRLMQVIGN